MTDEDFKVIIEDLEAKLALVMAERNEAWRRAGNAEEQWGRCEAKLATCEKYRDAYDKMGRIGTEAYRELEAKLAKAVDLAKEAIETMASGPFYPEEEERRLLAKLAEIGGLGVKQTG
jgi:hypothetical protein